MAAALEFEMETEGMNYLFDNILRVSDRMSD